MAAFMEWKPITMCIIGLVGFYSVFVLASLVLQTADAFDNSPTLATVFRSIDLGIVFVRHHAAPQAEHKGLEAKAGGENRGAAVLRCLRQEVDESPDGLEGIQDRELPCPSHEQYIYLCEEVGMEGLAQDVDGLNGRGFLPELSRKGPMLIRFASFLPIT